MRRLGLQFVACFASVQLAALLVCLFLMVTEQGVNGIGEGAFLWLVGQFLILPVAVLGFPAFLAVRYASAITGLSAGLASIVAGGLVGMAVAMLFFMYKETPTPMPSLFFWVLLTAFAGSVGGVVWWKIEQPGERLPS